MGIFDSLVRELASKFGLGAKAGPLVAEVLRYITHQPGGIAGFIERCRTAGLGELVHSWLGRSDSAPAMAGAQVGLVLPQNVVNTFASRLGLGAAVVTSALAVAIPKVIGLLTPGGSIPDDVPPAVPEFLGSSGARLPQAAPATDATADGKSKWLIPGVIVLGLLGLGWFLLTGAPEERAATGPVVTAPAVQPKIVLSNDDGVVSVSGVVQDEAARSSILDALRGVFGVDNVKDAIAVNSSAGPAVWMEDFKAAIENFRLPGLQALFDGASASIGGLIGDAERDRIIASLKSLFGQEVTVMPLADPVTDAIRDGASKTVAALNALPPGFTGNDVVSALSFSIINFASGSAIVPGFNRGVLQQAATVITQLPPGTVIEISGHTDDTGDPGANLQLSQQRADAVREVLVQNGVDPAMLTAKGYGASQPVASNETAEGRFQNRRIAYSVAQ